MIDMTVHAAVAYQAHKMQRFIKIFCVPYSLQQNFIFVKISVAHRHVYPLQFLVNDASGADIKMTDLAVSHLPVRQTDSLAGSD